MAWMPALEVRLAGCNMRCVYCESGPSSQMGLGARPFDTLEVARFVGEHGRSLRGVTLLGGEPTVHLDAALAVAAMTPPGIAAIFNTNALIASEARTLLEGAFDVFLPDLKYGNDACARRLSGVDSYVAHVRDAILWASSRFQLVVRHLLLPGHLECCTLPVLDWMAEALPGVALSLMDGYVPDFHAARCAELRRALSATEADRARRAAADRGIPLAAWGLESRSASDGDPARDDHTVWIGPEGRIHIQTESSDLACLIRRVLPELNSSDREADKG